MRPPIATFSVLACILVIAACDACREASPKPVAEATFDSNDPKLGDARFMFYDFSKDSPRHIVPIERNSYTRVYIIEVGSQSRNPNNVNITKRNASSNVRHLSGGGSTDKYQMLHELTVRSSREVEFNQPIHNGRCIRDEGQFVVIYTNKVVKQIKATMRDPLKGGGDNQYSGAPNENSISLIADDETNHKNRVKADGATDKMLKSAEFYAFEKTDNGFFLYKEGQSVPAFVGNGCDAQYEFEDSRN